MNGTDNIWEWTTPWTSFAPGSAFTVTTPNLPGYIYKHYLRHTWFLSVVFAYQPPAPGIRERRVIDTWDQITTPIYAVFRDPNSTFPPHHVFDQPTAALTNRPWYELMDCAMDHITIGGSVRTVTTETDAMTRLTNDLYVYPVRPAGPSSACWYNPGGGAQFYGYNVVLGTSADLRFNLYGMMLNTSGDCRDLAAYLECQARCIGLTGVQKIPLGGQFGGPFLYHPTKKCGESSWSPGPPNNWGFNFHQLTHWPTGGGVYDWAIGFNSGGTAPADWFLALGFSQSQEISTLVYSGSPDWSTPFGLGSSDSTFAVGYSFPTLLGSYAGP